MMGLQQPGPVSRLLQLPGELRNRIYQYAITGLTESEPIDVTIRGIPEPELLRTCKRIRSEAISIYYCENHFRCIASSFDSAVHFGFAQEMISINRSHQVDFQLKPLPMCSEGPVSWPNLKLWVQRLHSKELGFLRDMGLGRPRAETTAQPGAGIRAAEVIMMSGIFSLALDLRETPWSVVEGILENSDAALATLDAAWS
ncbi:hypothetical protein CLAFUW4_13772 [Fulvia fulva]|nr:hypothetical protein CLAFUR4_13775 [Fulvia fulva]KAK4611123.1 hypothetical protein CLAFUR0_13779 [Fulvia fulva]WPV22111.1 hypothetical protein CLAFUW4_13772 [Fulvia fulva]WPV37279.1 hypothetical protein CLAFUW7_13780 [Fulvia fulva]